LSIKDPFHFPNETNLFVDNVKAMGACGSKHAMVEAPPITESPLPVQAVIEKEKELEKVEPLPEETEENPGYEVPAIMVSSRVSFVDVFIRALLSDKYFLEYYVCILNDHPVILEGRLCEPMRPH
jgi:hypothetical protein